MHPIDSIQSRGREREKETNTLAVTVHIIIPMYLLGANSVVSLCKTKLFLHATNASPELQ